MTTPEDRNITWFDGKIKRTDREKINQHRGVCIWFTGLSASGKSTIAREVEYMLHKRKVRTYVLDGDNVRHGLNKDLGFSPEDRNENIRRISEVANLFVDAGIIVCTAFISPYREDRNQGRRIIGEGSFIEVFVKCDIETCEHRDPKGLYVKAKKGELKGFTGISAPYEEPLKAELIIDTSEITDVRQNAQKVIDYLVEHGYILEAKDVDSAVMDVVND